MKIGIIGAGNIGGNLTRRLTGLGHDVSVACSRGPDALAGLAAETGATPVEATQAAVGADLVIVTIPEKSIPNLPSDVLAAAGEGVPIVDTGNYYPKERDGFIEAIESGTPESVWVSQQLGRRVIKAFNGIAAQHLLDRHLPPGAPGRIALPVAGDDEAAKATVMRLVDELGFDPVDAGGLDESWRQQPWSPAYSKDLDAESLRRALAEATPDRPDELRA